MSEYIQIAAESVDNIKVEYAKKIEVSLENPDYRFIQQISDDDIVSNCESDVSLFRRLLENDDVQHDLHEYLRENGYVYNKG